MVRPNWCRNSIARTTLSPLSYFLARVISHIQEPRLHFAHYLGHYSNVSRGRRRKGKEEPLTPGHSREQEDDGLTGVQRRARRREWARLIKRIYEIDPLKCSSCGGSMRIISVMLERKVITKILGHLARKGITSGRAPPEQKAHSISVPF